MTKKNTMILVATALVVAVILGVVGLVTGKEGPETYSIDSTKENSIKPMTLADWIVSGRKDFVLLDLRSAKDYKKGHIKGAQNCASCHAGVQGGRSFAKDKTINLEKKVVLYTSSGKEKVQLPKIIWDNPKLYTLEGGYQNWQKEMLGDIRLSSGDSEEILARKKKKLALQNFFLGKTIKAPKIDVKPVKTQNFHRKPMANEGC